MRSTFQLGILAFSNILVMFFFQWYLLVTLGAGLETDAFFASMTLPILVAAVVNGSLVNVLVPLFSGESADQINAEGWTYFTAVAAIFFIFTLVLFLSIRWWVPLTVPGFSNAARLLTRELVAIQLIGMFFSAINSVQWAVLHARGKFVRCELSITLASVSALAALILFLPKYGVIGAAWILSSRHLLQTILLLPVMGFPVPLDQRILKKSDFFSRVRPLLIGSVYFKTDQLVDRFLLSSASAGSLSLYHIAHQVYGAGSQIIGKAVVNPIVPSLSAHYKSGRFEGLRQKRYETAKIILLLAILLGLMLVVIGEPFLEKMFSFGKFDSGDVHRLWLLLILMFGLFLGGTIGKLASASFYACGDTKVPTYMSAITYTIFIPIKIALFLTYGVFGLAAAISIYYLLNITLLGYLFKKFYENPRKS